MKIEQYIKKEMKDCPLTKQQEGKLLLAIENYLDDIEQSKKINIFASESVETKAGLIQALSNVITAVRGANNHHNVEILCRDKITELVKSITI